MRFVPDYTLHIIPEKAFDTRIKGITKKLVQCQNSGYFNSFDGKKIYYEYFLAENSRASVVIVHGLSEFTKKYYELTFYFLNQGYNVFLYDQRCHGLSDRLTDQVDLIHVDNFGNYVSDLALFIDNIVLPADHKPLYLYSHSMGGAVAAMYMAKYPNKIRKAVMSAPMIEPLTGGVSPGFARIGLRLSILRHGPKAKFPFSREFDPDIRFEKTQDQSRARFNYNMALRRGNPSYQSTPMTMGWTYHSLRVRARLLSGSTLKQIKTPILMLCAEKDMVVSSRAQMQFAGKCANCRVIVLKGATHGMLAGDHRIIKEHVRCVLAHYRD